MYCLMNVSAEYVKAQIDLSRDGRSSGTQRQTLSGAAEKCRLNDANSMVHL
jgi:hypothetical protein